MDFIFIILALIAIFTGIPGFYLLYRMERGSAWSDLVKTKKSRRNLSIASMVTLLSGCLGAYALYAYPREDLTILGLFVPLAIWLGLYFLFVALLYRPVEKH